MEQRQYAEDRKRIEPHGGIAGALLFNPDHMDKMPQ